MERQAEKEHSTALDTKSHFFFFSLELTENPLIALLCPSLDFFPYFLFLSRLLAFGTRRQKYILPATIICILVQSKT